MRDVDIADMLISKHGRVLYLTDMKLNRLVYYVQVESIREHAGPAFPDPVEAWECGPVEPEVHRRFARFGTDRITEPSRTDTLIGGGMSKIMDMVDIVVHDYGMLASFELAGFSHRKGSAWAAAFVPGEHRRITETMIVDSDDVTEKPDPKRTLAWGADEVGRRFPNALRLLRDS